MVGHGMAAGSTCFSRTIDHCKEMPKFRITEHPGERAREPTLMPLRIHASNSFESGLGLKKGIWLGHCEILGKQSPFFRKPLASITPERPV
jgi:hypothetical protein